MLEILSQEAKTYLLTIERGWRYRYTDINLCKADFSHAFPGRFAVPLAAPVSPAEGNLNSSIRLPCV
ncbi:MULTISPECIES: hypothetical protein [unclassified Pseudomonas]|uniref:hypothetical protein n=1 Tax=unclassified Pseudomonas TaxID=196821 RepID=UPI0011138696|nr:MULTISPECIES: hypothetical protein [unclassified Pseudomonas]